MTGFNPFKLKCVPAVFSAALLSGCASFSPDGGMATVSQLTQQHIGQPVSKAQTADHSSANTLQVAKLLEAPLTSDTAIQIALLNNQGLQAAFAELGVSEADYVQAGRIRNPGISFDRLSGSGNVEIGRSVMFDIVGLLTLPVRAGIEQSRFEQAKLQAATTAIQLAADTRRAFFEAVAARQTASYMEQVQASAEAAAALASGLAKVGNWSKLNQNRQQAFYAEAVAQVARSRQNVVATRERLTRNLGLWGNATAFMLPDRLPDLPKSANAIADIEVRAMTQRLDIQMAKRDAEATAAALGLTRATGLINVLDAGYINKSQSGKPRENGYQISLELPIFDWGGAKTAKAEALYMQAVYRTADTAIRARSEVREAYSAYRTSYDLARHYRDEVVPLQIKISAEVMLRYNGMLASAFELLADARDQTNSVNTAIEAQRDFWIADTALQDAIGGAGTSDRSGSSSTRMRSSSGASSQPQH